MSTPMWSVPHVTVQELPRPLPDAMAVLDVREQVEWDHGHIEGATHIPLGELGARIAEVPPGTVLVVCKVGGRSAQAATYLGQQGFDAINLHGGMVDWADAGRPMVSATGRPPHVI
jgi:rhodanese-related sulfurtransferase